MFMKFLLQVLIYSLFTAFYSFGQVSLRLDPIINGIPNQLKANVYLVNEGNENITLAGQNYRLYYNSKFAKFNGDLVTFLPDSYTKLKTVQHFYDQDASGYGKVNFEKNLGFINLACDYNLEHKNPLILKPESDILVFSLTFEVFDISNFEIIWAEHGITHGYATAFNELAQVEADTLKSLEISELIINNGFNQSFELVSEKDNAVIGSVFQTSSGTENIERSIKMPTLESRDGQFVVLGYCQECQTKLNQFNTQELKLFESNTVFKQVSNKGDAERFLRQLKNMGFSNVKIYKVNTSGSLESLKAN